MEGKPLRGIQGYSTVWADNASAVSHLSIPTSGNLAGGSPGVKPFRSLVVPIGAALRYWLWVLGFRRPG
jgi:hypothetical protein